MRGEHHGLITRLAIEAVLSRSDSPTLPLLRAVADYIVRAASSADRGRGGRSHHAYPSDWIIETLLEARKQVLWCVLTSRAVLNEWVAAKLAYTLHCLQDRCIPPHSREHARIERLLERELKDRSVALKLFPHAREVRSFRELRDLVYGQRSVSDPSSAAVCAFAVTYAALYAVFSRPEAPPELLSEVRGFGRSLRRRAQIASAVGLALCALQVAVEMLVWPVIALLRLLISHAIVSAIFAFVLRIALVEDLTRFLWRVCENGNLIIAVHAMLGIATPILLLELTFLPTIHGLILTASTAAIVIAAETFRAPLSSERFKSFREEIPWFIWD